MELDRYTIIDSRINRRTLGLWDSGEYVSPLVAQCYSNDGCLTVVFFTVRDQGEYVYVSRLVAQC